MLVCGFFEAQQSTSSDDHPDCVVEIPRNGRRRKCQQFASYLGKSRRRYPQQQLRTYSCRERGPGAVGSRAVQFGVFSGRLALATFILDIHHLCMELSA